MNPNKRVLLAILAHPDDETFGMGGTLAYYARLGVETYLVCATRGEVGDVDPQYLRGFSTIAERREAELRCAAEKLGLKDVFFMGYRDSGMPNTADNHHPAALAAQPTDKVAAEIAHYFRMLKPEVVVTSDPVGDYYHPDHIAIHKATVRAFHGGETLRQEYADVEALPPFQPLKLYYQTFPHGFMKAAVTLLKLFRQDPRHFGHNKDIDLEAIAAVSFPTHAAIDCRSVAKIRNEASACHASQGGQEMSRGFQGFARRFLATKETYMRAYPPAANDVRESDLFAGI